ncbi:MAG: DUF5714 domain-containing protein [Eubacteriales bacterium]|nr:DUF5714 domain-containing protein [Eubacteriales bacterium]
MNEQEYNLLQKINEGEVLNNGFASYLLERGYAFENPEDQNIAINKAYQEFKNEVAESQVQLMLVPTYGCNLACTYCFQHGIQRGTYLSLPDVSLHLDSRPTLITKEIVDAFFNYARTNFSQGKQRPFITLFGGEPLVNSPAQKSIIQYIVDKCAAENYELSAVTNGYDFIEYIDILKKVKIKEIQFTLDGSKDIHDNRRATVNKKGTFDRIVAGIEAAVNNKMPVNLRSVVDTENIEDIVNLAEFLDKKGWLDLPPELFKTQIGRNYELFDCYTKPQHLMTQVELWSEFASLSKAYPVLTKFHRPDFKGIRHLVDTGEMYMASFDTCPACKTEWVFDLYGNIYGCTASCGREEYLLGTFWPEVNLNAEAISTWRERDVRSIPKCRDCKYDVICGGGCGVVAANQNGGNILSPDCRPVQELMEIGINHYIDNIRAMSGEDAQQEDAAVKNECCSCNSHESEEDIVIEKLCCGCDIDEKEDDTLAGSCCPSIPETVPTCCCGTAGHSAPLHCSPCIPEEEKAEVKSATIDSRKTEGCLICGHELLYSKDSSAKETCNICGQQFETYAKCPKGHYICDTCHSLDILGKVEQLLTSSDEKNPVILAQKVFDLPGLNMHGPEYHSIVPAVLVTAYQNISAHRESSTIKEAIKRGKDIKGGSCGLYGDCGACVGSGIAVSMIEGATPMSHDERSAANRATGYALLEISKYGGPRCCKREAITSIESFLQVTSYFDGIQKAEYTCTQFGKNKDCIGKKCPYFPVKS